MNAGYCTRLISYQDAMIQPYPSLQCFQTTYPCLDALASCLSQESISVGTALGYLIFFTLMEPTRFVAALSKKMKANMGTKESRR